MGASHGDCGAVLGPKGVGVTALGDSGSPSQAGRL
jgi:hypothetical protein